MRSVGIVKLILEMKEEPSDLGFTDLIGLLPAEFGQFADGPQIAAVSAWSLTGQVEIVAHLLIKFLAKELGSGHGRGLTVRL